MAVHFNSARFAGSVKKKSLQTLRRLFIRELEIGLEPTTY